MRPFVVSESRLLPPDIPIQAQATIDSVTEAPVVDVSGTNRASK
jgi:hypothetical protein